ncbi:DUF167 domain-containing protein [archaeon]|nr:DUF167 domain-containing protein [archaeon]
MRINAIVKANASNPRIVFDNAAGCYTVYVKSPAEQGKANLEVVKLFKKEFGWHVRIIKGARSKRKILRVG